MLALGPAHLELDRSQDYWRLSAYHPKDAIRSAKSCLIDVTRLRYNSLKRVISWNECTLQSFLTFNLHQKQLTDEDIFDINTCTIDV